MKRLSLILLIDFCLSLINLTAQEISIDKSSINILNEPIFQPEAWSKYAGENGGQQIIRTHPFHREIDSGLAQQLQNVLDEYVENYWIKGLSAAISTPNRDIWTGSSGISHDTVTLTPDMLMGFGSITKNYVAAIVLQLHEEGVLSIYDSLHHWLPNYQHIDSTITIEQLLNHTSGIFNYTNHPNYGDSTLVPGSRIWTVEETLDYFILEPYFTAGSGWEYSNTNYLLAGMIIEAATGNAFATELQNRITTPLGLDQTFIFPDEVYEGFRSHVWLPAGDSVYDLTEIVDTTFFSSIWTAGSILSTASDIVKWSKALNEDGFLNDTTLELMKTPAPFSGGYYGLGTQIAPLYTQLIYGHTGSVIYLSQLFYIPEDSLSIAIVSNQQFAPVNDMWLDLYFAYTEVVTAVDENIAADRLLVYPNPVKDQVNFKIEIDEPCDLNITLYNNLGQPVAEITDGRFTVGQHQFSWQAAGFPAGLYTYKLEMGSSIKTGKLILTR